MLLPRNFALVLFGALSVLLARPAIGADVIIDPYYGYRDEVERGEFSYDESQDIPWIENETEVLAVPRADDLVSVQIDDMPAGLELLIDTSRISVDPTDRVVRAWLWVRSKFGAENGTFEGYRCETGEYKVYAYANPTRTPAVTKAKRPRWLNVDSTRHRNYRAELLRDYFCSVRGTRSVDEIRQVLNSHFQRVNPFSN